MDSDTDTDTTADPPVRPTTVEVFPVDADGTAGPFAGYATLISAGVIALHPAPTPPTRPRPGPIGERRRERGSGLFRVAITDLSVPDWTVEIVDARACPNQRQTEVPQLASLDVASRATPTPLPFPADRGPEPTREERARFLTALAGFVADQARLTPVDMPLHDPPLPMPVGIGPGTERPVPTSGKTKAHPWCWICPHAADCRT